jgi:LysR family hydrogen peroxide-inducible transcriptional activator
MTRFSFTQIEYVLAVVKHGHFAKAAHSCHVTQPTLSMQIQKLESDLGVIIFDRSKRPILLTEVGQKIVAHMQTVLFEARKVNQIIELSQRAGLEGALTLAVIPTLAPYVLPLALPALEKSHPGIELKILEQQTQRIIEALGNDEIDVGLLATPLHIPSIREHALFYEPFSVLCHEGHPLETSKKVRLSALEGDDIWLLEEGHCLRNQVIDICAMKKKKPGKKAAFQFESGSIETLKNLVDAYGGYTLVPELATSVVGRHSRLVPFERPIPAREVGLVFRREHYKQDLIEALAETIIGSVPERIRKIRQKDLEVIPID